MVFGVVAAAILGVWWLVRGDYDGAIAAFLHVAFFAWVGFYTYTEEIKKHREAKLLHYAQVHNELRDLLEPGAPMAENIEKIRANYPTVGHPRYYHQNAGSACNTAVLLETEKFNIWLYGREGVFSAYDIK